MKGLWVQDPGTQIWHLQWRDQVEKGIVTTWCHVDLAWDAPSKEGIQLTFHDTLHDECARKAEKL